MGQCAASDADNEPNRNLLKAIIREFPNIDFYRGDYPIALHSPIIFHLKHWSNYQQQHQLIKFYQDLESDKSYMQWLYPNFFQSFMNTNSFRLTPKERNNFIANEEVMKNYRLNTGMFLRYLGIVRNDEKKLEIVDENQLEQCLFVYSHNLNRIQRFLSSLSVLGMREEALEFIELLQNKLTKKHKLYIQKFQMYEQLSDEKGLESTRASESYQTKSFSEMKGNYVQSDLLDEPWVTVLILSKEQIQIPIDQDLIAEKKEL